MIVKADVYDIAIEDVNSNGGAISLQPAQDRADGWIKKGSDQGRYCRWHPDPITKGLRGSAQRRKKPFCAG
ncbi:hypothetical protein [Bradyrhizobium nanningense]|uniref:hypothetical protein n=1 Tax=Bradyrhizobium nanningense TaxID=1325118 RepID=UPI0010093C63|nr:hypothetical protein [Bradyrhizobium nanningense]